MPYRANLGVPPPIKGLRHPHFPGENGDLTLFESSTLVTRVLLQSLQARGDSLWESSHRVFRGCRGCRALGSYGAKDFDHAIPVIRGAGWNSKPFDSALETDGQDHFSHA